jgi:hypothetical protein
MNYKFEHKAWMLGYRLLGFNFPKKVGTGSTLESK